MFRTNALLFFIQSVYATSLAKVLRYSTHMEEDSVSLRTEWEPMQNGQNVEKSIQRLVFVDGSSEPDIGQCRRFIIYILRCNCRWFQTLPSNKHMHKFLCVSWEPAPVQESFIAMDFAYEVIFLRRRNVNKQLIRKLFDLWFARTPHCSTHTFHHFLSGKDFRNGIKYAHRHMHICGQSV